jgi:hypothetical protein
VANGRLVGLDFFAHYDKASLGLPVPKFKAKLANRVDCIDGLPLIELVKPTLEISGQSRYDN